MSWRDVVKGQKPKRERQIKTECNRCGGVFRDTDAEEREKRSKEDIMFDEPLGLTQDCSGCEDLERERRNKK